MLSSILLHSSEITPSQSSVRDVGLVRRRPAGWRGGAGRMGRGPPRKKTRGTRLVVPRGSRGGGVVSEGVGWGKLGKQDKRRSPFFKKSHSLWLDKIKAAGEGARGVCKQQQLSLRGLHSSRGPAVPQCRSASASHRFPAVVVHRAQVSLTLLVAVTAARQQRKSPSPSSSSSSLFGWCRRSCGRVKS